MTTITTTCAGCGRQLAVPERYQGRELKCPGCGHSFRLDPPAPAPVPRLQPPPPTPPRAAPPAPQETAGPFGDLFTVPPGTDQAPPGDADTAATVQTGPVYWRLKRLGVVSTGLVSGVIYAALGLLVGIAVAVASVFLPGPAIPFVRGRLVGGLAIVVFPLLYGVAGFVIGALTALLYNVTARLVGGVKLLLE
jgi:hypothetical protein